jgi:LCP family protein required for cell wall assembly
MKLRPFLVLWAKALQLGLSLFVIALIGVGIVFGYKAVQYVKIFQDAAGISVFELRDQVRSAWNNPVEQQDGRVTFLILGTDELAGRPVNADDGNILTDSIMLASFDIKQLRLTQISFPRDLWIDRYKTRINALYFYGHDKDPQKPTAFPKQVVEEITGVSIQHVVVLNLETVAKVIDALGGIDVQIDRSFTDEQFPRAGVDVTTVHDPKFLYETVSFTQGVERMNGARALVFIRSRHSKDLIEGSDEARIQRQQKVIQAMMARVMSPGIVKDPAKLGALYRLYSTTFSSAIPFNQVVAIGHALVQQGLESKEGLSTLQIKKATLSIRENGHDGVLIHPDPRKYAGQWLYIPVDPSWLGVQKEIRGFYDAE